MCAPTLGPAERRALDTYIRGSSEEGFTGVEHPWQAETAKETLQMGVPGQEDRWALVGGRKGRRRHPPGALGLGEECGETRRNTVGCTMERHSQFSP